MPMARKNIRVGLGLDLSTNNDEPWAISHCMLSDSKPSNLKLGCHYFITGKREKWPNLQLE